MFSVKIEISVQSAWQKMPMKTKTENPLKPAKHFCKVAELNHKVAKEWLYSHASNKR